MLGKEETTQPGWFVMEGAKGSRTLQHWQRSDTREECVKFMFRNGWTLDSGYSAMFWNGTSWMDNEPSKIEKISIEDIEAILRDNLSLTCGRNCEREMSQADEATCYRQTAQEIFSKLNQ